MSDRQPVGEKCLVTDVARVFTEFHRTNSSPRTFDFDPLDSFVTFLDDLKPHMLVDDLRPYHVTQWIETRRLSRRSRRVKGTNEYRTSEADRPIRQNHRRNLIRAVKAAFKWAEEQEHIDRRVRRSRARTITSASEKTRPGPCRLCRVRLTIYAFNPHRGCQSPESAYRA